MAILKKSNFLCRSKGNRFHTGVHTKILREKRKELVMSIASVAKLMGPKIFGLKTETVLKTVMTKGFASKNNALPKSVVNALRKEIKPLDEFVTVAEQMGYKNIHFKYGLKGDKNTVTGLVNAYSGKTHIGYLAGGLDANAAKPLVQLRGKISPQRGMDKVNFNFFGDYNKPINTIDSVTNIAYNKGKTAIDFDAGAIKGHLSGDLKQVMAITEDSVQAAVKKLQTKIGKLEYGWNNKFEPGFKILDTNTRIVKPTNLDDILPKAKRIKEAHK